MSDLPDPKAWYATIVESWRGQVFSKNLLELLTVTARRIDLSADARLACERTLAGLESMQSDSDLRHWVHERAAVPESIALLNAVDLVLGRVRAPTLSNEEFALMVQEMQREPGLRGVARIGLTTLLANMDLPPEKLT